MATYEKPETNFEERGDTNTNEKDYFEEKKTVKMEEVMHLMTKTWSYGCFLDREALMLQHQQPDYVCLAFGLSLTKKLCLYAVHIDHPTIFSVFFISRLN